MHPKLVATAGPLAGHSFTLPAREGCVGRAPYNWLTINSPTVSRQHFLVELVDGRWRLVDLDSRNGTIVNEEAVRERWIENGDRIQAGESEFLFVTEEEDLAIGEMTMDERAQTRTILVFDGESSFLRPWSGESVAERRLNALLRISAALQTICSADALREHVKEQLTSFLPNAEVRVEAAPGPIAPAVLTEELVRGAVHFCIRAPMVVGGVSRGGLTITSEERLSREHLDLVTAVAALAALGLENLARFEQLERDNRRLLTEQGGSHEMVGDSGAMERVYATIRKVAPTDSTVMILGENGTGKELVARAIHRNSNRRDKGFVAVNCAALKDTLMESELFGHEKGAFTGAIAQKKGRIEIAEGGTLFLDEIGELDTALQAKLLRVLQEREFERVGGTKTIKADVRVIAATNRDLKEEVRLGRFREDLFYRLHVITVKVPPLRERREDIPVLASHFIERSARMCNRRVLGLTSQTRDLLVQHDWPGNVRELQNTMERAVVLGSGDWVQPEDLPETLFEAPQETELPAYHEAVRETKKRQIVDAIQSASGNISEAARLLGVHPNYLHRLVTKLGLRGSIRSDRIPTPKG